MIIDSLVQTCLVMFGIIAASAFSVVCFGFFSRAVEVLGGLLDRYFKRHLLWDFSIFLTLYLLFIVGLVLLLVRFFQYLMENPIGLG